MSSGGSNCYRGSFLGVADDIDIETVPFRPAHIEFWGVDPALAPDGFWGLKIDEMMPGDDYISIVAADDGVTVNHDGFTVANGADINRAGVRTYFICWD